MVSGPTPPGTGVYAPASSNAFGCTSPTIVDPRLAKVACALRVAGEEAVKLLDRRDAIDADIDNGRARLHHLRRDEPRSADRGDQDVGLAA